MNTSTAIVQTEIEKYMTSPQMLAKFEAAVNRAARPFIQSVLVAVEQNDGLLKCTPESIGIAALRAATLQLSCDPSVRQAHLVPYKRNKKKADGSWTSYYEAVFQPHYMGLYTLAMRTGKYRTIDVLPTPAGYQLVTDLEHNSEQLLNEKGQPVAFMPKVDPAQAGGWYGYFVTKQGHVKKVYWTVQEIHKHAAKFSKNYNSDKSSWKDPNFRPTMEKKTVLLDLLRWADMTGINDPALSEAMQYADDVIDAETDEPTTEPLPSGTTESVDQAFPNGSERLMQLREKAKKDAPTAYWEAVNAAGIDKATADAIKQECGGDMLAAFEKVAAAYAEVI